MMKKLMGFIGATFLGMMAFIQGNTMEIQYKLLTGIEIQQYLPFIVQQSIDTWRAYPYLYDGTYDQQEALWRELIAWKNNAVVIALYQEKPVGFMAGVNFSDYNHHFSESVELFKNNGLSSADYYYIVSCIVLPEFRGRKIMEKMGEILEGFIKPYNYSYVCFATSNKDENDPLRPADYRSAEHVWLRSWFKKTNLIVRANWDTLQPDGSKKDQEHELVFWVRPNINK